jgi:hypothetical protein
MRERKIHLLKRDGEFQRSDPAFGACGTFLNVLIKKDGHKYGITYEENKLSFVIFDPQKTTCENCLKTNYYKESIAQKFANKMLLR